MPGQHARNADTADETDLIARAVRKDEAAVRAIIKHNNQRLFRIARSVLSDDGEAEDALQQAYVRAFTSLATFRGESQLSTWLSRIVLNEALGRLRARRPTVDLDTIDEQSGGLGQVIPFPNAQPQFDPERQLAQRQIQSMLERAIDDLPDAFRTVLVARVIEEMSVEETAELLDLRPETVKTRLHRARRLVKESLEKRLGPALTQAFPFDGWRCDRMADRVVALLAKSG